MKSTLTTLIILLFSITAYSQQGCSPDSLKTTYLRFISQGDSAWAKKDTVTAQNYWRSALAMRSTCSVYGRLMASQGIYSIMCDEDTIPDYSRSIEAGSHFYKAKNYALARCYYEQALKYVTSTREENFVRKMITDCDEALKE